MNVRSDPMPDAALLCSLALGLLGAGLAAFVVSWHGWGHHHRP
ncbi:hypothetical protein [Streptomyces roseirectus]|nr:hypothetical protein [Streptomyces roseirectus]